MFRFLLLIPILLLLIVFAASNPQLVTLAFWPTEAHFAAPLSVATLAIAAVFFLAGALTMWVPKLGTRLRAQFAERRVDKLQGQITKLEEQVTSLKGQLTTEKTQSGGLKAEVTKLQQQVAAHLERVAEPA